MPGARANTYGAVIGLVISVLVAFRSTVLWTQSHWQEKGMTSASLLLPPLLSSLLPASSQGPAVIVVTLPMLETAEELTRVLPWYLLVSLGCYCLFRLGCDLLAFNNCPEEVKKLEADIVAAREDLKKRGLKLD